MADGAADNQVSVPFAVCTDDVPGCLGCVALVYCIGVGPLVVIPQLAFSHISLAELPPFIGIVQSGLKALTLFFLADVKEEFQNRDA